MKLFILTLTLLFSIGLSLPAQAAQIDFDGLSGDSANAQIAEANLIAEATDLGNNQVAFIFSNSGPEQSSITEVYFRNGTLLEIASIDNSDPGVQFSEVVLGQRRFGAQSDIPINENGVEPGESLGIVFNLTAGSSFSEVLADLGDGGLHVKLHVGDFDIGGEVALISEGISVPTPEPGTFLGLSTFCAIGLGFARRPKTQRAS